VVFSRWLLATNLFGFVPAQLAMKVRVKVNTGGFLAVNQFRFDSHEPCGRFPLIVIALISGTVAAFLMLVAIKFTGLGPALLNTAPVEPRLSVEYQPVGNYTIEDYEKTIIEVYNRVKASVVMITTATLVEEFDFFNGASYRNIQGLGSGVVFRHDGYILTNKHVVGGAQGRKVSQISVVLANGKSYPAKVVGVDSQSDLAVLKIDNTNLAAPLWGDSSQVRVGQTAIAIGNPLAENLQNTVTVGVVSATGRVLNGELEVQVPMIQTDASINPGNSGGPLINRRGEIIGINTMIAAKSQGIGFSIPANTVKNVVNQLITKGYVSRPGLGLTYIPFLPENVGYLEARLGYRLAVKSGLFIVRVVKGSSAALTGLRPGDIITKVEGREVKDLDLVKESVARNPIGAKIKLEIYRNGKTHPITVKIGELRQKEEI
jgi:serine protease Do